MVTKIETLDDLRIVPKGVGILLIRKAPEAKDSAYDIFVHGTLDSVDGVWLNVDNSMRVPLGPDSTISKSRKLPDFRNYTPEGLLQCVLETPELMPREKSVVSYRLTGWSEQGKDFPSSQYEIHTC